MEETVLSAASLAPGPHPPFYSPYSDQVWGLGPPPGQRYVPQPQGSAYHGFGGPGMPYGQPAFQHLKVSRASQPAMSSTIKAGLYSIMLQLH